MKVDRTASQDVFTPPASYSQERLWFLDQLEPATAVYNIPFIATVKGSIHRPAFNRAVNRLIARHESLRTFFVQSAGRPRQAIHGALTVEVDYVDLSRLDGRAAAEGLQAICTEVTSTPFDLGAAPLFRIMLAATVRETTIITTIHHIVADGWSIGVFQRELSALYQEELGGRPAALPALRIQYADYAVWQREHLEGDGMARLKEHWCRHLEDATTVLEIPGDFPRPLKQTFNGSVHMFDIDPARTARIRALAARHDATLFMTLFAAFAVLLYRVTGQTDVLVGTPIAGRKSADVEHLVGLFVNTLVLRAQMSADEPFAALLSAVRHTTLDAFEHQDMPFEKLVLELNPKRDLSHSPLVQILFSLQNIPPLQELLMGGTETDVGMSQNLDGHTGTAKFDFALFVSEVADRLQCSIEFNTDLFSAPTVRRLGEQFVTLLDGIMSDPGVRISSYPLMTGDERRQVLARSHGPQHAFSPDTCHRLFERQCLRSPEAFAIAHPSDRGSERLTYGELNASANRIAHYLAERGVRPGDTVGICMPRSIHQIAVVLAIVKAGAAYVPLDPEYPLERLRVILGDSGARLLVTSVATRVSLDATIDTLVLEQALAEIESQPSADPAIDIAADSPLYVIYTSGSTGKPKGVVMPHRSIVNLIEWQARASSLEQGAATLQYASLNFDVASQEIFATLTSGGCLHVIDESVRREAPRLLDYVEKHRLARLFLPPVTLEQVAYAASATSVRLDGLREIIVAGERLQVTDIVRQLFANAPRASLVNQYGPTESHVVSAHTLAGDASLWPTHPPIGRPIDNVQLYVLDENLEPTPPRVAGELYIGGVAVALGYWRNAEETGKRFVADPFSPGGGRLYRTGDACSYDDEGVLSFIGRTDHQIKLRGFRIEPGEVEVVLKQHVRVKDAVVVKRRSRRGDDELAAYFVTAGGAGVDRWELRAHLADKLPAYMVPTHFVELERLPMTGSGKIDRLKLPDPAEVAQPVDRESQFVAPRTQVERFLADCWCGLLQVDRVSIRDNFFDFGGHSLSATQLVSRIRDEFGVELPLYNVFERPTIELLAMEIIRRQALLEPESDLEALLSELESLSEEDSDALSRRVNDEIVGS